MQRSAFSWISWFIFCSTEHAEWFYCSELFVEDSRLQKPALAAMLSSISPAYVITCVCVLENEQVAYSVFVMLMRPRGIYRLSSFHQAELAGLLGAGQKTCLHVFLNLDA